MTYLILSHFKEKIGQQTMGEKKKDDTDFGGIFNPDMVFKTKPDTRPLETDIWGYYILLEFWC